MKRIETVLSRANERRMEGARPAETNVIGAYPPLGIAQIAAVLRDDGHGVRLVDGTIEALTPEGHAERIGENFCGIAGFSTSTLNWPNTYAVIRALKKIAPEAVIVVGGPQLDAYPNEIMGFAEVDYGIVGEGEFVMGRIVRALESGKDAGGIPGVLYKENEKIKSAAPGPPIEDLGSLPFPALDLLPLNKYRALTVLPPLATLITSRGCPFRCRFCSQQYAGGRYRARPISRVLDEIEDRLSRFRTREFIFFDETFTIGEDRVIEFCEGFMELGVRAGFNIRTRADCITADAARALAAAGCTSVNIGIESGSRRILDLMNKSITVEDVKKAVHLCHAAGLTTRGYFMLGYVDESVGEMEQSLELACALPLDYASFTITQLNPATPDYLDALARGDIDDYWRDYTLLKDVPETPPRPGHALYDERFLQNFLKRAYAKFYLRPQAVSRRLADRGLRRWLAEAVVNPKIFFSIPTWPGGYRA